MIEAILQYVTYWLTLIVDQIRAWFEALYYDLIAYISGLITSLAEWFSAVFETVVNNLIEWGNYFYTTITDIFTSIGTFIENLWSSLVEATTGVLDQIGVYVSNLASTFRSFIETAVTTIHSFVDSVTYAVGVLVESAINDITAFAEMLADEVRTWLEGSFQTIEDLWEILIGKINESFEAMLGGAGSLIDAIESRLSDLGSAFAESATDIVQTLANISDEALSPIRDALTDTFKGLIEWATPEETEPLFAELEKITSGAATPSEYQRIISTEWRRFVPSSGIGATIFFTIMSYAGTLPFLAHIGSIQSQIYLQDFAKTYPYQLLNPADVTAAWRRGLVGRDRAIDAIQRQGYTADDAETILHLSDTVLTEQDAFTLWHRDLISDAKLTDSLFQRGYDEETQDALIKASFPIPPIADLIVMAVREAFSPEVAETFGQYEDFPEDFAYWGAKSGLTEEWAKRYWASHWALPSPQQGFEMLHRGVIGKMELNLLLRALDVMPFWRDKLTAIAYAPFTRVDIRRMHKVGVLNEGQVEQSYRDIGYNEEKAKQLTKFTLLLNAPKNVDDEIALTDLTRSSILGFYADGLIDRVKSESLLTGIGYSTEAAGLYLDSVDYDEQRKERKEEVDLTLALAEAGILTPTDAEARLLEIGLETNEVTKALATLTRRTRQKTKIPSRGEGERMFKAGILSLKDYKDFLSTLGYADKWVEAYVELAGVKDSAD